MKIKVLFFAAVFFLLSSIASCGSVSTTHRSEGLSGIFLDLETRGSDAETVEALERYIEDNYHDSNVDEAILRLAGIYAARKETARAAALYQRLIEDFPASPFKFDALYDLGQIRFKSGKLKDARYLLEAVSSSNNATVALRARARVLIKEIEDISTGVAVPEDSPAIGVLLPLEGSYSRFGDDALLGVLLASGAFGDSDAAVEVIVRHAGSDAPGVEAAVNELASNRRVLGIVGPLLSATAADAAAAAQRKRIPMITLTQRDGVTAAGEYVYRNFLTPDAQAAAIARYSCKTLGKKTFAVLYPQNNYGTELARAFTREVKACGGSVAAEASYPPGSTDFSAQMKHIFAVEVKEKREGRRKIKEYTPTARIDALYIPDFYEPVSLILPYMNYYNIEGVQLLGSNGWNSPKLMELAGRKAEGAVFVDGFFASSSRPSSAAFSKRFLEAFGRPPGVLEAQAFDAASLLISAYGVSQEWPERQTVNERLMAAKGFEGATGAMSFGEDREAVKSLFILTVRDRTITELAELPPPAPASGAR